MQANLGTCRSTTIGNESRSSTENTGNQPTAFPSPSILLPKQSSCSPRAPSRTLQDVCTVLFPQRPAAPQHPAAGMHAAQPDMQPRVSAAVGEGGGGGGGGGLLLGRSRRAEVSKQFYSFLVLICAGARGLSDGRMGATHTDCLKGSSAYFTAAARGGSPLAVEGPRPFWLFQRTHQDRVSEEHESS